jgi:hypothetical protein
MAVVMLTVSSLQAANCSTPKTEVVTKVTIGVFEDRIWCRVREIAMDFDGSPVG